MGKPRSGRKFSFVTDTLYKPSIADEVRGSDLLVCEGMFEHALLDQAKEKKQLFRQRQLPATQMSAACA